MRIAADLLEQAHKSVGAEGPALDDGGTERHAVKDAMTVSGGLALLLMLEAGLDFVAGTRQRQLDLCEYFDALLARANRVAVSFRPA